MTLLLVAWGHGDRSAADQLIPIVYDELHRVAERAMRNEDPGHTLQPTALINEVYLKLAEQSHAIWKNRAQFFGVAGQAMRRILVDHARARRSAKRGGGADAITLDNFSDPVETPGVDVLDLHEALEKLETIDRDQARIIELRYFTGLNIEETADALGISPATVKREWAIARAWLRRELSVA